MKNLLFFISLIFSLNNFSIIGADLEQNENHIFECPGCHEVYATLDEMKDCIETPNCYGHSTSDSDTDADDED